MAREQHWPVDVVGIGADGWAGISREGRARISSADVVVGSDRQLGLLPDDVAANRALLPSPLHPGLAELIAANDERRCCVLASGDPMFYGIGSTLVRTLGADRVRVVPHVSSLSLACARLGWPVEETTTVSAVARPMAAVAAALAPGRRVLVLVCEPDAGERLASLLRDRGFGSSRVTLLERLGTSDARIVSARADAWSEVAHDRLAVLAVECVPAAGVQPLSIVPGLADDVFDSDGQLTKREVRAVTLSSLAPTPHELLWDVGAGTGTIGIEWMRCHPSLRAIAVEPRADRCARIAANAEKLGVPALRIVSGSAPDALAELPRPDAVFVGGAVSVDGVIETCVSALGGRGRLVANAVTVEAETTLAMWHARLGGELVRISVSRAAAVGAFTGWRPAMPVTQWSYAPELTA